MDVNEHGVEGELKGTYLSPIFIPQCCLKCKHFEEEYDDYSALDMAFCLKNIFFPTKKGTCKRQEKW